MKYILPLLLVILATGCRTGMKPSGQWKNVNNSSIQQTSTDNSRTSTNVSAQLSASPQVARSINNYFQDFSKEPRSGFEADNVAVLLAGAALSPRMLGGAENKTSLKNNPSQIIDSSIQIINGNSGSDSSMEDVILLVDIENLDYKIGFGSYESRGRMAMLPLGPVHPSNIDLDPPSYYEIPISFWNPTPGEYSGSVRLMSKNKKEINRRFRLTINNPSTPE